MPLPIRRTAILVIVCVGACGPEPRVSVSASLPPPLGLEMLTVTVRDPERLWRWRPSDFTARPAGRTPTTAERRTSATGTLEVGFQLTDEGVPLSAGSIQLPLSGDWRWSIEIRAVTADPTYGCFGCAGTQAFPLPPRYRAPGRDSIWVVWGGNSISSPRVY